LTRSFTACAALALTLSTAVCVSAAAAPANPPIDGITCDASEGSTSHIHQHVAIFDHGRPVVIPNDVGRPKNHKCIYWMHTHGAIGIVHIESPVARTFSLGNFFDIWGKPLSATAVGPASAAQGQVRAYLDGRPYVGDPRSIKMTQHAVIVLEAGPPYVKPPPFTVWKDHF
jgi:hypothetical protein